MNKFFPAEWHPQAAVQLTWPHIHTDWADMLSEVEDVFVQLASHISNYQKVIIVTMEPKRVEGLLQSKADMGRIVFVKANSNDTWARDHGGITIIEDGKATILNYKFNGWGLKFPSNYDNQITAAMVGANVFSVKTEMSGHLDFVFEGGGIESDGRGTLLTTEECLLSKNRNEHLNKGQVENRLKCDLGANRVLWLKNGYLAGDDTDSHIDTLARFCDEGTIAYVQCLDKADEHYGALKSMENELVQMRTVDGNPYRLVPLPMAEPAYFDGDRLPATYANFLITNKEVLVPTYGSGQDQLALDSLQSVFGTRKVVGINCLPLIKQHGSLHCVTMQYPIETMM